MEKVDLKQKVVRFYDYGMFCIFLGQAIANDFKRVEVYVPWDGPFPTPDRLHIGTGIPGITRVDSWEDGQGDVDLFIFPDVGAGDKQLHLRQRIKAGQLKKGARVFGAGESGELEMNRGLFKRTLQDRGLPTPKWGIVKGFKALLDLLQKEDDLWIKLDTEYRGVCETFQHETYEKSLDKLYSLGHDLGCFREICNFMWEKPIKGVESGYDEFVAAGVSLQWGLYGWEQKGDGYLCKVMDLDQLCPTLMKVRTAMAPVEKKYNTCGAISTEIRVGPDKKPYYIDACRRFGNPPAASISRIYKNPGPIFWAVAGGEQIKPEFNGTHAAELSVDAAGAESKAIPMELTEKDMETICLRHTCRIGGTYYHIPFKDCGSTIVKAVGIGNSRDEAEYNCIEAAEKFKCKGKSFDPTTFEKLDEDIKKGVSYGLDKV
jgi:hypothetical protein